MNMLSKYWRIRTLQEISNSDVVKPFITARDITERPGNQWIVDFGSGASFDYAASFGLPFEYVETNVKLARTGTALDAEKPFWEFQRSRPAMRRGTQNLDRFVVSPRVSKHRIFTWAFKPALPDTGVEVFARGDDYFIGVPPIPRPRSLVTRFGYPSPRSRKRFQIHPHNMLRNFPVPPNPPTTSETQSPTSPKP